MDADASPDELLAEQFEQNRDHLRAVARRMLGSAAEADDAVQETWIRFRRAGTDGVENIGGWLTAIVARVCLDQLRSRSARREEPTGDLSGPLSGQDGGAIDPEQEALLADAIGPALLMVLDTLAPAERLAFVLHDLFAVPFDQIAEVVGRSPAATRQLASRGRRRVQGRTVELDRDRQRQRQVVDAFLAASRGGDFAALVAVLDPDVELTADPVLLPAGVSARARGAAVVARRARSYRASPDQVRVALVDGAVGLVTMVDGAVRVVFAPTVEDDRIVAIEIVGDPDRLARLQVVPI